MTAIDRDPLTIAREVLDLTHEDETVTVCSVPDNKVAALARAVNELTAERDAYIEENMRLREVRARMAALADQYDAEARLERREGNVSESINTQATADRIRTALNGDHT